MKPRMSRALAIVALLELLLVSASLAGTARMTRFRPETNGFQFGNSYRNDFIPALDVRTDGLCGGMSYSALDYYNSGVALPTQPFQPAVRTALYDYLYSRQVTSITSNLDKWAEIGFNPAGARDGEFFDWGLEGKPGGRLDDLRASIDRGVPCVLGMQGDGSTGNHQVIAYGYDMGRYKGDLGAFREDFKIFICDPNDPGESRTLIPDLGRKVFTYAEDRSKTWRTYFVDRKYHAHKPPRVHNGHYPADGKVYELALDFHTHADDLRGGSDNVDVTVLLSDGTRHTYRDVNLGARWVVNCEQTAEVALVRPVPLNQISSLIVHTTSGGGVSGDNWDMGRLDVYAWGGGFYKQVGSAGPKRFTGSDSTLAVSLNPVRGAQVGSGTSKPSMLTTTVTVAVRRIGVARGKGPHPLDARTYPRVRILDEYPTAGSSRTFSKSLAEQQRSVPIDIEIWQEMAPYSGPRQAGPPSVHPRTVLRTIHVVYSLKNHRFTAREGGTGRYDLKVSPVRGRAGTDVLFPASGAAPEVLFSVNDEPAR